MKVCAFSRTACFNSVTLVPLPAEGPLHDLMPVLHGLKTLLKLHIGCLIGLSTAVG